MKKLIYLALFVSTLFYSCEKGELEAIAPDVTIEAKATENILANETSRILLTIKSTQTDAIYTVKFNTDKLATLNGQTNNGEIILRNGEHILTYDPNDVEYGEHNITLTITNDFGKTIEKKFKINVSDTAFITVDKEEQEVIQTVSAFYNFSLKNNNTNLAYQAYLPEVFPKGLSVEDKNSKTVNPGAIFDVTGLNPLKIELSSTNTNGDKPLELPITFKSSNGFSYTKIIKLKVKPNTITISPCGYDESWFNKTTLTPSTKGETKICFESPLLRKVKFYYNIYLEDEFGNSVNTNPDLRDNEISVPSEGSSVGYFQSFEFNGYRQGAPAGLRYVRVQVVDELGNNNISYPFKEKAHFIFRQNN